MHLDHLHSVIQHYQIWWSALQIYMLVCIYIVMFNVPDDSIYNPGTHTKISHKQETLSTWSAINRIEVMKTLQDVWIAEWQKVGEDIAV